MAERSSVPFQQLARTVLERFQRPRLRAQDEDSLLFEAVEKTRGHRVTIRLLRAVVDNPKIAARLREAARAVTLLNHPSIVPISEAGEHDGIPYIVTDWLERLPLAAMMGQIDFDKAIHIIVQVGKALEYAHQRGIIHGGLSPLNVLIGEQGQVSVTGFGLATLLQAAGRRLRAVASPYIAPELAEGILSNPRSDVYSLAAILYALLTGHPPAEPGAGYLQPVSEFNPVVPPAVEEIIARGLDPNPVQRYASAGEFIRDLLLAARAEHRRQPVRPAGTQPGAPPFEETIIPTIPMPEPLPFPETDLDALLRPSLEMPEEIPMPPPLPMPEVNWEGIPL